MSCVCYLSTWGPRLQAALNPGNVCIWSPSPWLSAAAQQQCCQSRVRPWTSKHSLSLKRAAWSEYSLYKKVPNAPQEPGQRTGLTPQGWVGREVSGMPCCRLVHFTERNQPPPPTPVMGATRGSYGIYKEFLLRDEHKASVGKGWVLRRLIWCYTLSVLRIFFRNPNPSPASGMCVGTFMESGITRGVHFAQEEMLTSIRTRDLQYVHGSCILWTTYAGVLVFYNTINLSFNLFLINFTSSPLYFKAVSFAKK